MYKIYLSDTEEGAPARAAMELGTILAPFIQGKESFGISLMGKKPRGGFNPSSK